MTDNPLLLEFERQQATTFPYRAQAVVRLLAALHESAHAVVALRYSDFGDIHIPWRNPTHASAGSWAAYKHEAEVNFAGVTLNNLVMGWNNFAPHDGEMGLQVLFELSGADICVDDGTEVQKQALELLDSQRAYLSSAEVWPCLEALACEAMKHEALPLGEYRKAAKRAGLLPVGPKRRVAVAEYLSRFSRSPADLIARLGSEVVAEWQRESSDAYHSASA